MQHTSGSRSPIDRSVCLLTGEYPPDAGGVGDYTARLADALADLGISGCVLTRAGASGPPRETRLPVHRRVRVWDIRCWPVVRQVLQRIGPRPILHIQYQAGAFDLGGWVNLLPLWIRVTVPHAHVVTTFHDFRVPYLFPKAGPARLAANRLLARASSAAIFAERADLAEAGSGVRGHVIPIGSNVDCAPPSDYDRDAARVGFGADSSTLLIGYFGFVNQSKGADTLLGALRELVEQGRQVRLLFIGAQVGASDPTDLAGARELRRLVQVNGLSDRVAFTGYLEPSEVSASLLACDVLAQPYVDGASLRRGTLMAAIAHGMPIVSTTGSAPYQRAAALPQLRDGDNLLLVPPGDAEALADALARVADDPELRARLRAGARAMAEQIAWPTIARRTAEVYAECWDGDS